MSSKKDKFLESAQKFIAKGQLDRAIKDYEQVVALDPGDIRHRQRLAELFVRAGRKGEAVNEYEAIGKYYADNAYYLKAIAVYKQIQKLDPANINTALTLAVLNEKQGLVGNALAEYNLVFNRCQKEGNLSEALKILDKMMAVDPENLNTQLKCAETRFALGHKDDAYEAFAKLALSLLNRGDKPSFDKVCDRIQKLFPDRNDFLLDTLSSQIEKGDVAQVIPRLQEIIKKDTANLRAWRLLADAYRSRGENENLRSVFRHMIRFFPDESFPREGLIRSALDEGDKDGGLDLLNVHAPYFMAKGEFDALERFYLVLRELAPTDAGVLEGLKHLYEASGESGKLAEVTAGLSFPAHEEEKDADIEDVPSEPQAVLQAETAGLGPEVEWEEEIDLSHIEEMAGRHLPPGGGEEGEVRGGLDLWADPDFAAAVEEAAACALEGGAGGEGEKGPEEVELEIEIGETGNDWLFEGREAGIPSDGAAQAEPGLPEEMPAPEVTTGEEAPPARLMTPPSAENEFFDLGAELLSDTFGEGPEVSVKRDKYSLDGMFSAFKKGVDQQLDKGDTETHYNLGIAYKEMGLFDDAIAEFQAAALDPKRKIDCLTLQGICCRDKGDVGAAEELFKNGIARQGGAEELSSLKYELALLYEGSGRMDEALQLFQEIRTATPDFRDAARKIVALQGGEDAQGLYELDLVELDVEEEE